MSDRAPSSNIVRNRGYQPPADGDGEAMSRAFLSCDGRIAAGVKAALAEAQRRHSQRPGKTASNN